MFSLESSEKDESKFWFESLTIESEFIEGKEGLFVLGKNEQITITYIF